MPNRREIDITLGEYAQAYGAIQFEEGFYYRLHCGTPKEISNPLEEDAQKMLDKLNLLLDQIIGTEND